MRGLKKQLTTLMKRSKNDLLLLHFSIQEFFVSISSSSLSETSHWVNSSGFAQ